MAEFNFITDDDFRICLESDFSELEASIKAEAWKSVHVLAGSIIEATLLDTLISLDYQKTTGKDPLKMDLGKIIDASLELNIITRKTAELSSVVKSYRNLIHPGRVIRLSEFVDKNSASIAKALVEMIVEDVKNKKKTTYGYTAEQILSKIETDSSVLSILTHLFKDCKLCEIERLLLKVIPKIYFREIYEEEPDWSLLKRLGDSFRRAFSFVPDDIKKKVTMEFIEVLRIEGDDKIIPYQNAFFRVTDLNGFDNSLIEFVKAHLIGQLEGEIITFHVLDVMDGLIKYISPGDAVRYTDALIRIIASHESDAMRSDASKFFMTQVQNVENDDVAQKIIARLRDWISKSQDNGPPELVKYLKEIESYMSMQFGFKMLSRLISPKSGKKE